MSRPNILECSTSLADQAPEQPHVLPQGDPRVPGVEAVGPAAQQAAGVRSAAGGPLTAGGAHPGAGQRSASCGVWGLPEPIALPSAPCPAQGDAEQGEAPPQGPVSPFRRRLPRGPPGTVVFQGRRAAAQGLRLPRRP